MTERRSYSNGKDEFSCNWRQSIMATLSDDYVLLAPDIMASFEDEESSEIQTATTRASTLSSSYARIEVLDEIEKSRVHWSEHSDPCEETDGTYHEVCEEDKLWNTKCLSDLFATVTNMSRQTFTDKEKNREITKLLLDHNIRFGDPGKDLVLGELIAEGSQAVIYEAEWANRNGERDGTTCALVFKVFKTTFDLRRHCPLQMLRRGNQGHFTAMCHGATLLEDGRFAFVYERYWGSLDKLLRKRRKLNPNVPPFFLLDAIRIMLEIARGMRNLYMKGLIHRDLKSANILVECNEGYDVVSEPSPKFSCNITDYESSLQVVGTGFWRAPEVLRHVTACREGHDVGPESPFTEKADVYSYAMTCYEVLTGCMPLSDVRQADYDVILIHEQRPALPDHLPPWITKLLAKCWHTDPSQRPAFHKIEDEFIGNGVY